MLWYSLQVSEVILMNSKNICLPEEIIKISAWYHFSYGAVSSEELIV